MRFLCIVSSVGETLYISPNDCLAALQLSGRDFGDIGLHSLLDVPTPFPNDVNSGRFHRTTRYRQPKLGVRYHFFS